MVVYNDDAFVGSVNDTVVMGSWITDAINKVKGLAPEGGISLSTKGGTVGLTKEGLSFNTPSKGSGSAPGGIMQILKENWMYIAGAAIVLFILLRKKG